MTLAAPQLLTPWRRTCARCHVPTEPTGSRVIALRYFCRDCLKPTEVREVKQRRLTKAERARAYGEGRLMDLALQPSREALIAALAQAWITGYDVGQTVIRERDEDACSIAESTTATTGRPP